MANKLNETSEFTIPLKNLISLVAFVGLSVWGYFAITERLAFLEHTQEMMIEEIEENDAWIDDWKPPAAVELNIQRVRELELRIVVLEHKLDIK